MEERLSRLMVSAGAVCPGGEDMGQFWSWWEGQRCRLLTGEVEKAGWIQEGVCFKGCPTSTALSHPGKVP